MKTEEIKNNNTDAHAKYENQKGTAIVYALFIIVLLSAFVALALFRTTSEATAIGNETAEARTTYAAQGSLEMMTRNFNKVFEVKLNPTALDLAAVQNGQMPLPLRNQYDFTLQELPLRTSNSTPIVLPGGPYAGLYAIRDNWRLRTTVTELQSGIQVQLTRNILNNRIPIFQFGIFYDDDLELFRPPKFSFGGRVHSNRHFFISPGSEGVFFDSRVTAAGQIITQTWRNGYTGDSTNSNTKIKDASGVDQQLFPTQGSVLNTTSGAANNIFSSDPDLPPSRKNPNWATDSAKFDGNLQSEVTPLKLPLKVGANRDLIEMVKRGKEIASATGGDLWKNNAGTTVPVVAADQDDAILRSERFANKTGIRVSLADSKAKLPGCASGTGTNPIAGNCGVRLDGNIDGLGADPPATSTNQTLLSRGYQPKPMRTTSGGTFNYQSTRVNGERLYTGGTRQVWIKVETVDTNPVTGAIITREITQDFLSLGITEQATQLRSGSTTKFRLSPANYDDTQPSSSMIATTKQAASPGTDSRSILKLQRFIIPGPAIPGGSNYLKSYSSTTHGNYNVVVRYNNVLLSSIIGCTTCSQDNLTPNSNNERYGHLKLATVNNSIATPLYDKAVVPFPIQMFDTREGTFYDNASLYRSNKVTQMGVMSMIDIDVANLRRFFRGDFNDLFPTDTPYATSNGNVGLVNTDIPQRAGWVLYVSDRRGDADFDGEFDMEDIYGYDYDTANSIYRGTDGVLQKGEDFNLNGVLDVDFVNEAPNKYNDDINADNAAVTDHKFYRRGIRLINGTVLPGIYDSATAANTRGFTVSSENGVYVQGNYNATGVASVPSSSNTPFNDYQPFNTPTHIPASIVADGVTILSNSWNDSQSFSSPYNEGNRLASTTQMRFAMLSGDTIASIEASPHQGGLSPRLNGGVHNFKRFLERWTGNRLDFSGSLINLFYSHNQNGAFKCCNTVYDPPVRNWVFDSTFLDASRLPPGTPFFQFVQTTGFQRTND